MHSPSPSLKRIPILAAILGLAILLSAQETAKPNDWVDLFDGKTLASPQLK
jgi:hypothetical protein